MINAERGEVALRAGGRIYVLCLTLGGLAALERAFGVRDLAGLGARLKTMTDGDLRVVLDALLTAPADLSDADPGDAAKACAECFRLAFTS